MTPINRREFLSALPVAGAMLAGKSLARWSGPIGVQLYTVRNEMQKDFSGTLRRVARIGFREVEFAGYFGHDPREIRAELQRNGLTAPSAHVPIPVLGKEWDKTIDINLKGAFLSSKAVLPFMIKKMSGVIINVSSGAGKKGFPDISAYCASKFGMIGLTESLAWEVGNYNVKVMAICPGEVDTKMQEDFDREYYGRYKDKMLRPKQVAEKIIEMIFNDNKYNSGQSVEIG